ncbi:MAG TPA: protein kinase, partial [Planctomycetota bacterium]|nr:protein kinase [Planctomycetota bacterium]
VLSAHVTLRPDAVERFRREATTAARLRHPGIVEIYAVGEHDGTQFFAMERIDGAPLDRAVEKLRSAEPAARHVRSICRLVVQVADALAFAHRQGVIHRDVKPSNVLVRPDGAAVLTDFGLAREEGSDSLTLSGHFVGTPHYTSPEVATGGQRRAGERSDVYALGVTLYECLTTRRPFEGSSPEEVLAKVVAGETLDPQRWSPGLPRDLATIVMKAIDRDPARRYATAAAFADDLRAFLELRPISARRASTTLRFRRWVQRRPAVAAACGIALAALIVGPSVIAWREHRAGVAIAEQRDLARASLAQARAAIDRMLLRVADEDLRLVPQVEPVRRKLLEDAVVLLESLGKGDDRDPETRLETSRARTSLGRLLTQLGRPEEAERALAGAIETLGAADTLPHAEPAMVVAAADAHRRLGEAHQAQSESEDGARAFERAEELYRSLAAREPGEPRHRLRAAEARSGRGSALALSGPGEPARESFRAALAEMEGLAAERPDDPDVARALGETAKEYGLLMNGLLRVSPRPEHLVEVRALREKAVAALEPLARRDTKDPEDEYRLAIARTNLASTLALVDEVEKARSILEETIARLRELAAKFPASFRYKETLAEAHHELALIRMRARDAAGAEAQLALEAPLLAALAAAAPTVPEIQVRIGFAEDGLGQLKRGRGATEEADGHTDRAIAAERRALELNPNLYEPYDLLFGLYFRRGEVDAAADAVERLPVAQPDRWQAHTKAASGLARCAAAARRDTELADADRTARALDYSRRAVACLRGAIAHGYTHFEELEADAWLEPIRSSEPFRELLEELRAAGKLGR